MRSYILKTVPMSSPRCLDLSNLRHCCLELRVGAVDCVKEIANTAKFIWALHCDFLRELRHRHIAVTVNGYEVLK